MHHLIHKILLHFRGFRPAVSTLVVTVIGACSRSESPPQSGPGLEPESSQPADVVLRAPRPRPLAPVLPEGWTTFARDAITVAFSRDDAYLLTGDLGGHTAFQSVATGRLTWADLAKAGRIRHVVCATDADICLASGFDGADLALRLYRTVPLEAADALGPAEIDARSVALSASGARIAAVLLTDPPALTVRDVGIEAPALSVPTGPQTGGPVALTPSGDLVAYAPSSGGLVVHRVPSEGAAPGWTGLSDTVVEALAFPRGTADGTRTLFASVGAEVLTLDLPPDSPTPTVRARTKFTDDRYAIRGLHALADGRVIAATRPPEGGLVFWDSTTGAPLVELETACPCETHTLSHDGTRAACCCADRAEVRHGPVSLPGPP